jgi:hypothetical protein
LIGNKVLDKQKIIKFPLNEPPKLIVVIDTEEEFDWTSKPSRETTSVSAMREIYKIQNILDEYNLTPCYVVDYPIASKKEGYEILKQIYQDGRCEIGAQLHPWVNPPYDEELSRFNTFPGNLPEKLEEEKVRTLLGAINEAFGIQTKIYKAGRYGFGPNTPGILERLGLEIDLSFCPPFDHSGEGGPDYSSCKADPFWFGSTRILEIPVTGAFVGWAGSASKTIYKIANQLRILRLTGILAKISAVDRLLLTPEGFDTEEHIKITKYLYERGTRVFTWSFHSPSVVPGYTPYVRSELELHNFLDSFHKYFDYFFNELKGEASTPTQIKNLLDMAQ